MVDDNEITCNAPCDPPCDRPVRYIGGECGGLCIGHGKRKRGESSGSINTPLMNNGRRKRKITRLGDLAYIPLGEGENCYWAIVDWDDMRLVEGINWYRDSLGYVRNTKINKRMHQLIRPDLKKIDHINRDPTDNRRSNLRDGTGGLNEWNSKKREGYTSRFRGVSWSKGNNKWFAATSFNKKPKYLGLFISEEDAAKAYDKVAFEIAGEYANLNFPGEYIT